MRAIYRFIAFALLATLLMACSAEITHDDRVRSQRWEHPPPYPAKADALVAGGFIAFDQAGCTRWLDPHSGASSALERHHSSEEPRLPRDVVYDRWRQQVLVFFSDEDDQSGEIVAFPLTSAPRELGDAQHYVWVDGRVRMLPVPEGLVLFEQSYGERWRSLRADGQLTSSRVAPWPASAFATVGDGATVVHGLAAGAGGPEWLSAPLLPRGFGELAARRLEGPQFEERPSRMADLADGTVAVVSAESLSILDSDGVREQLVLPPFEGRLEGLVALSESRLALLLAEPAAVMIIDRGDGLRIAQLPLPGRVEPSDGSLTRSLAVVHDSRLLAATRAGVFGVDVVAAGPHLELRRDPDFDGAELRGPIAGPI